MHAKEHLQWLEDNNLLQIAKANSDIFKRVLINCLDVKREERILMITDHGYENRRLAAILSGGYYLAARDLGMDATVIVQEPKIRGDKADDNTVLAMKELSRSNVLMLSLSGKLGSIKEISNSYRSFVRENKHRFISAISLGKLAKDNYSQVIESINVDYNDLQTRGQELKKQLDKAENIRVTTDAGTDLRLAVKPNSAIMNAGNYRKPEAGGNIPAGEVYLPPKWKNVEGKVVIDGSSAYRNGTQLIETPITLNIKKGSITDIQGGVEAENLRQTLDWAQDRAKYPWGIRRIGELGIGINPKAKVIGATIIDEKSLRTAHVGIGSNYWFGGTIYAIIHLDQVFKDPKIYVDGNELEI